MNFLFDLLTLPLLRKQFFGFAGGRFRQEINHRALVQFLGRVTEHGRHLRVYVLGPELGVEHPGSFVGGLEEAVAILLAVPQCVLEVLALEIVLHLTLGDGQPDVQRAHVVRLGQKIIGSHRQHLAQILRLARGGRDHDENFVAVGLRPHPFAELKSVHAGQVHIHEQKRIEFPLIGQNGLFGIVVGDHLVTAFGEKFCQHTLAHQIVFNN